MTNLTAGSRNERSDNLVPAWPHRRPQIFVTERQVRDKVIDAFAAEFDIAPDQVGDCAPIKKDLSANFYRLAAPIMTIENFFRTRLEHELSSDDLSICSIVDKIMGRASDSTHCAVGGECACAA